MKDLKTINTDSDEISRLQSNLQNWAQSIKLDGVNNGLLLKNILLSTGVTNLVEHKLGREPRGWFVMPKANSIIWSEQDSNVFKTRSLALACSADVTADIWIF